jgi:ferredoxin
LTKAIAFACETGETVLDAAERAGYSLPYSCRKGICSTCEGELCRGTVSVGSNQFAGPAGGVLLCQARPQSDVLIQPLSRMNPVCAGRYSGHS